MSSGKARIGKPYQRLYRGQSLDNLFKSPSLTTVGKTTGIQPEIKVN
jgi:hypothetical protein